MNCPHCSSSATAQLSAKTSLGYPTFRCSNCSRRFNERTGTQFNHLQFPTDIVLLVVLWRLRYKQGSSMRARRDLAEMFLVRGFEFSRGILCGLGCPRLGSSLRLANHRATPLQTTGKGRSFLVRGRNLRACEWQMVLSLSSH